MKLVVPIYFTIFKKTKKDKTFMVALNWLRNAHHFESNKVKQHYHGLVHNQLVALKAKPIKNRIRISYTVYCKSIHDGGNIRSVIEKFVLDGLVEFGLIRDDCVKYVVGDEADYIIVKDNFRCEIEIKEIV